MSVFHTKLEQVALDKGVENKFVAQSQKNDLSIFNPEFLKKHKNSYINFDEYYTHHNQYIIVPWGSPIKEGFVLTLLVVFHFVASCFLFNYIFHGRFLGLFLTSFVCFFSICIYLYGYRNRNDRYVVFDREKKLVHIIGLNSGYVETILWEDIDFLLFEKHVYELVRIKPAKISLIETANLYLLRPGVNGFDVFEAGDKSWPGHGRVIRLSVLDNFENHKDRDLDSPDSRGILINHHLFYKMLSEFMEGNSYYIEQRELVDCLDCIENMEGDYQRFIMQYKTSLLKIPFQCLPEKENWQRDSSGNWQQLYNVKWNFSIKGKAHKSVLQPPALLHKMSEDYPNNLTKEQNEVRIKITSPNPELLVELEGIDKENNDFMKKINIFFLMVAGISFFVGAYGGGLDFGFKITFFLVYIMHMPWYLTLFFLYLKDRCQH